ncbi:hypothetical protein ASE74_11265 [Pedobacter sp. Leaf216]|uniref:hypothetical protein n=1 Tax=Pedobacter sp. Leaf216 TaxID=1735684 RepID=UPI0006FDA610|nr:hypothetical protein [Pedobacter sp. Leaf216]KQM64592.1 hypothetical protein ASE74_11265 [Pedobacter sp. Leaf216]
MKLIFTFLICIALSYTVNAQQRAKYTVRVVDRSGNATRGSFYAAADDGVTIIRNRRDTVKLSADSISALYIHRKGIAAPLAIAGGLTFFVLAAKSDKLVESVVLIAAGVPVGVSGGLLIGGLFSNKKNYKGLQAKDFPLIKSNLKQYTVLK